MITQVWSKELAPVRPRSFALEVAGGRVFFVQDNGLLMSLSKDVRPNCLPVCELRR